MPACVCPGTDTFTCSSRERLACTFAWRAWHSWHALAFAPSSGSLAQLLALSGLPIETFRRANVQLLPLRALSGPELHRHLSLSAHGAEKKKGVSQSCRLDVGPGMQSCAHVRLSNQTLVQPERTSGHGDPPSGSTCGRSQSLVEAAQSSTGCILEISTVLLSFFCPVEEASLLAHAPGCSGRAHLPVSLVTFRWLPAVPSFGRSRHSTVDDVRAGGADASAPPSYQVKKRNEDADLASRIIRCRRAR